MVAAVTRVASEHVDVDNIQIYRYGVLLNEITVYCLLVDDCKNSVSRTASPRPNLWSINNYVLDAVLLAQLMFR